MQVALAQILGYVLLIQQVALAKLVVLLIVQAVLAQLENEDMPEQIAYATKNRRNLSFLRFFVLSQLAVRSI